jgi:hypothetical protein
MKSNSTVKTEIKVFKISEHITAHMLTDNK